jgi:hypothetical protein
MPARAGPAIAVARQQTARRAAPRDGRAHRGDAMPPPPSTAPATKPATTKPFVLLDPATTKPIPVVPGAKITWSPSSGEKAFVWAVYYKQGSAWKLKVVPGDESKRPSPTTQPPDRRPPSPSPPSIAAATKANELAFKPD